MEITVLNSTFEIIGYIDVFESLLWADRYDKFGEFELVNYLSSSILSLLSNGAYICIKESEHTMMIEDIRINSDAENGPRIVTKGRSLESILLRRVIWNDTPLTGDFQDAILQLLNENAITTAHTARRFTLLEFSASTDPAITDLTIDTRFYGEFLYDALSALCADTGIGFKIVLTDAGKFQFKLYSGVDRSYSQSVRTYVVFSPNYDNLINSNYVISTQNFRNSALVAGAIGIGDQRVVNYVDIPWNVSDLDRREIFVDAQNISKNLPDGSELTDQQYQDKLEARGYEELTQYPLIQDFDGDLEPSGTFTYGEDFFMGDVVQVSDDFGHESSSRVTEIVFFQDPSGIKTVPTFSSL